ncbi:MAG: hypothetical protein ACREO5_13295 [Candidatus Binatia bacterium]
MKLVTVVFISGIVLLFSFSARAQHRYGRICGDPNVKCVGAGGFQPWELTFALPKNVVIYESELFYSVVLKSVKVKDISVNCDQIIKESDRTAAQKLFPKNKVFAMNCFEAGSISYTNVANNTGFMAVYAGKTLAQANAFLKTVIATGKFRGATIRRMRAQINGT